MSEGHAFDRAASAPHITWGVKKLAAALVKTDRNRTALWLHHFKRQK